MKQTNPGRAIPAYFAVVLLAGILVFSSPPAAQGEPQQPKKPGGAPKATAGHATETKSKKGSGAQDANIKSTSDKNQAGTSVKVADNKAPGAKTKGTGPYACTVHIDNRTNLYIKIFIDGVYVGYVNPGGDGYSTTHNGPTTLYARADFTDGSWLYWGPVSIDCEDSYTWRLWP